MRRDILLAGVAGAVIGSWLTLIVLQLGEHGFSLPGRSSNTVADSRPAPAPAEAAKPDLTPLKNTEAPKPAETAKQSDADASKTQPEDQAKAQPAKPAPEAVPDKAAPSAATPASTTTPDGNTQLSDAAVAAAAAATPSSATDDVAKTPGGDAAKTEDGKAAAVQPVAPQENKTAADPTQSADAPAKLSDVPPAPATADVAKSTETGSDATSKPSEAATDSSSSAPTSPQPASADQAKTDPAPDNRMPADQIDREAAAAAHRTLPPPPQSEPASLGPAQKPQEQAAPIELIRPFSDQAGVVTVAGKSVRLVGIIPTDVDRMCTSPGGKSWPCGQAARTAFRMYLRGRTIDCDLPSATWQGTVVGACRYVRIDLSAWLVRFGWAEPEPGSPLAALVEEAKQKKRGIYGDDPRKNGKSTLGPALPKEDPLNPI